jgi:hypothetical protein
MTGWIKITPQTLPPEGEVVETKIDDDKGCRNECKLVRKGSLWFYADLSMYVYYTPTHWRSTEPINPE